MLTFHGGFSLEEVEKLKKDEFYIFDRMPWRDLFIPNKNTFDYYPFNMTFESNNAKWEYIREDIYQNQYIFLFKYLCNTLEFCHNGEKKNYILVCDIDEEILNDYIGVGRYIGNKVEYRLPRKFITSSNIVDFLYYEGIDKEAIALFKERFKDSYSSKSEDMEASEIMKTKRLIFNEYKNLK